MGSVNPNPETQEIRLWFNGETIGARSGDTIAASLIAHGHKVQSQAINGDRRGLFCGMGICHDCLVVVDGNPATRSCMTKVQDGMKVEAHPSRRNLEPGASSDLALYPVPAGPIGKHQVDALVVGAGPAGLKAAIELARAGAKVVVVDERPASGGQFYKQPAHARAVPQNGADRQSLDGRQLISDAHLAGVDIRQDTLVWGGFREDDGLIIGTIEKGVALYYSPRVLIIATGAYEQPALFPGWTLPGVMTTGACQTLVRSYGVVPGKKILIGGNGPLNFQVAIELARAGAEIVGVVESAPAPWMQPLAGLRLFQADPVLAFQGMKQLSALKSLGIPVFWSHKITEVTDDGQVNIVDTKGNLRKFDVDTVAVTEGFSPSNELSRLLGCAHQLRRDGPARLEVVRDDYGATSQDDIFVIGEAGGFGGAHIAMAQGELSGREAARRLGFAVQENAAARKRLQRHRAFQKALWGIFSADAQEPGDLDENTLICRCETLTLQQLKATIDAEGVKDLATLKRLTRAGMGRCQGRYCLPQLGKLLDVTAGEQDFPAPQMPLRPIPLAALAVEKPEWGGHKRAMLPPAGDTTHHTQLDVKSADVVIIGAGVVGLSTALFLARNGVEVVVVDRGFPNARASGGNAGSLHAQLLSFDHGSKAEGGGSPAARTLPLQVDSIKLWQQLETELGKDCEIKITGGVMVAETEQDLRFLEEKTRLERSFGIDSQVVGAQDLQRLEPALDPRFVGAAYCPQEGKINPLLATQAVMDGAMAAGARIFAETNVSAIHKHEAFFEVVTSRGTIRAGKVVNAAGGFASQIGRMLDIDVPVFGAPLQMIVTEAAEPMISTLVAHVDRHLTLKQAANGNFLIGGGWTAGLDPVHNHPRPLRSSLEGNLWVAQHVVPALRKLNIIRSWAAMNINIDGAPLLGEDHRVPGFYNAVTSNGYTLAPLVGKITADLIRHGVSDHDVNPFSTDRFRA